MKRIITLITGLAFFTLTVVSKPVSVEIAKQVGKSFMNQSVIAGFSGKLKMKQAPDEFKLVYTGDTLVYTPSVSNATDEPYSYPSYYVFSTTNDDLQHFAYEVKNIKLCDLQGREVINIPESHIEGKISLPLNKVADGVYYVQIHIDNGMLTQKIIVKR